MTSIWDVPRLVGRYCSYLLPKQAGKLPKSKSTQPRFASRWVTLYNCLQICLSSLWDRAAPRRVVALCLALCSAAMLAFGASGSLPLACACLFASGAGQAPIWPACTKVLSAWYDSRIEIQGSPLTETPVTVTQ